MAHRKYDGPYVVEFVPTVYDWSEGGWQVASKPFYVEGDDRPHTTVNSPVYAHRQSAYRRCAALNKAWQRRHPDAAPQ